MPQTGASGMQMTVATSCEREADKKQIGNIAHTHTTSIWLGMLKLCVLLWAENVAKRKSRNRNQNVLNDNRENDFHLARESATYKLFCNLFL